MAELKYTELPLAQPQIPAAAEIRKSHVKGLYKLGKVIIPDYPGYPAFVDVQPEKHINRMVDYMYKDDRGAMLIILSLFSVLPLFIIRWKILFIDWGAKMNGIIGAPFKMLQIALKGLVFTIYYSDFTDGKVIHENIGYDAKIVKKESDEGGNNKLYQMSEIKTDFQKARKAEAELRKLTVKERIEKLSNLKKIVLERREWIIEKIQGDTGKSRSDALVSEIFGVLDHLVYLEKNAAKALADKSVTTPIALMGKKSKIYFEPLGTVLIISPWNYPFYQAVVPITAAFVAGNSVIYKPSEHTPLMGVVEELLKPAGFKEDWVKIVYGDGKVGATLIDLQPDKIMFTGSGKTGKKIMEQAAKYLIPVELELGGKDPMIVFDDANIVRAAAGAVWGGLTNLGQSCTSVERIYIQQKIYNEFKTEIVKQVERIKQETDGDGDADVGAMTVDFQVETIKNHLDDAKKLGAEILTGNNWDGKSKLIPPMVIDKITPNMKVITDESFGPFLPLVPFNTEEDAIAFANGSEYGLSASVWTKDMKRADRVARAIKTGNVSVNNVMLTEGNPALPFGGAKNSGFGRFKGEIGLHSFCNIKSVLIDKDSSKIESNWFPYTKEKYEMFSKMTEGLFTGSWIKFALTGMKLESYSNKAGKQGRKK
ncbi:MAG TPA: aldehyde dehydrogenase family protein [Draconibacterium sp.]|nr:aldehyde dehydrogenase family protein [Draconibacterium sp.]